jgi:hypothetical protein
MANKVEVKKAEEKKVPFIKKVTEWDDGGVKGQVIFKFRNGQVVVFEAEKVSPENEYHLMMHGASQKIGDTAAEFSKELKFGDAYAEMVEVRDLMYTKDWSRTREGGGTNRQLMEDLAEALSTLKKQDIDTVKKMIATKPKDVIDSWVKNTAVNKEIMEIRNRRAQELAEKSNDSIDDVKFD